MQTPGAYIPRLVDATIDASLRSSGAVLIEGPNGCGKTWTGMTHAKSAVWVADQTGDYMTKRLASSDPLALLGGDQPVLIDEWQGAPGLWDAVRGAVDRRPGPGQYLLTSSATPRDGAACTGIEKVTMAPMSLAESGASIGTVSLRELLDGETPRTIVGSWKLQDIVGSVLRGGWPGTIGMTLDDASRMPADYLRAIAYTDASMLDGVRRDPARFMAFLGALARNTATLVQNATLAREMVAVDGESASTKTVAEYIDVARRLHILREIPAWTPALRSPIRLRQSPKRILCDPSLAAAGLRASPINLLADRKTLPLLFKTLCLRDLSVYSQVCSAGVFHYRDETGLDVDAIVVAGDGRWMGVEIRLADAQVDAAAKSLLSLSRKMVAAGEQPPASLLVVTGYDSFAHRRDDGVVVVPVDVLGP